ncbi:Serine/threonine-protein kinase PknD [Streptomyces alboniger]
MSNGGDDADPRDALLGGRYRLVERIGSGGMGTVWRARDELVEREVAVKQPRLPGDLEDEEHRRAAHRLYREARAAARVDHPAAVSIYDVVVEEEDGLPWIVMELVRGESLHQALRRGPLPPREAARVGLAVLGALRAAHAVGIVHRDVKPANVLLGPHHRVVLTDFGIAHVQGEESLTATGDFVGSLEYVAPERMSGTGAGPPSDLWSLGVLLYTAVEGSSPFRRTAPETTLAAIVAADPPEAKRAGPLRPLMAGLLAKDPEQRPDAEEAARVLESVAGERRPDPGARAAEKAVQDSEPDQQPPVALSPAAQPSTHPNPPAQPSAAPDPPPDQQPPGRRPLARTAVALLGVLLAGAIWLGTSFADGTADGTTGGKADATAQGTPQGTARATTDATPPQDSWGAHRDQGMNAALFLPAQYKRTHDVAGADDAFRMTAYSDEAIQVRLIEWDKSPGSPLAQASRTALDWEGHERSAGQYTATSFHGDEAALSDVTYDPHGRPTRVMQLIVRTDDDRMYQLRVDMPKGTPDEKKGMALFKKARAQLEIGNNPSPGTRR